MDGEGDEETGDDDERELDQKRPSPAERVVDPTAKDASYTRTDAKADVADALPEASLPEGDEVGCYERGDGVEATETASVSTKKTLKFGQKTDFE